uniref:Uncharacterized protein n=1 Tax=Ficedula albicollis TaxID=59894 RepID=A0A803W2R6_FICAL
MPENVVEEKIKQLDLNMVMAEIRREGRPGAQWRYSEVSFLELDKFLEDVRNGIYPLMNFAVSRPLALPRALSQPQEDPQKAKTPTPEPFDVETRKLTLLLILEDKLHRQLSYDLLPTDNSKDLATELVHYGFIHEVSPQTLSPNPVLKPCPCCPQTLSPNPVPKPCPCCPQALSPNPVPKPFPCGPQALSPNPELLQRRQGWDFCSPCGTC